VLQTGNDQYQGLNLLNFFWKNVLEVIVLVYKHHWLLLKLNCPLH